jgi:hypothetical protein
MMDRPLPVILMFNNLIGVSMYNTYKNRASYVQLHTLNLLRDSHMSHFDTYLVIACVDSCK